MRRASADMISMRQPDPGISADWRRGWSRRQLATQQFPGGMKSGGYFYGMGSSQTLSWVMNIQRKHAFLCAKTSLKPGVDRYPDEDRQFPVAADLMSHIA